MTLRSEALLLKEKAAALSSMVTRSGPRRRWQASSLFRRSSEPGARGSAAVSAEELEVVPDEELILGPCICYGSVAAVFSGRCERRSCYRLLSGVPHHADCTPKQPSQGSLRCAGTLGTL